MKWLNKKGDDTSYTITGLYIIGIVVLIIILTWAPLYAKSMKDKGLDALCQQSITLNSGITNLFEGVKKTGLECTAQHYEFKEDTKVEYMYDMYDLLDKCWIKTIGQKNQLAEKLFDSNNFALVCYSFDFKEGSKTDYISKEDFSQYMSAIDSRYKRTRSETFDTDWKSNDNSHFLLNVSKDGDNIRFKSLDGIDLTKTDEKYLVVLAIYKLDYLTNDNELFVEDGWSVNYLVKDWRKNSYSKHVFIIPESSRSKLGVDINLWQRPK